MGFCIKAVRAATEKEENLSTTLDLFCKSFKENCILNFQTLQKFKINVSSLTESNSRDNICCMQTHMIHFIFVTC